MNSQEIKQILATKWTDDRYLHIYEAPVRADRTGTTIDVLVVGLWRSLKFEFDAVEIKVSYADWCREWKRTEWIVSDGVKTETFDSRPKKYQLKSFDNAVIERVSRISTVKNWEWRDRSHRFWVAAPLELAERIAEDVRNNPELAGWGVLAVTTNVKVLIRSAENKPKPLTHQQWIGVMRATADSGKGALERAYNSGHADARTWRDD